MKQLLFLAILISLSACTTSQVSCKTKPLKHKKYRVTKTKLNKRTYSANNTSRTNTTKKETIIKSPSQNDIIEKIESTQSNSISEPTTVDAKPTPVQTQTKAPSTTIIEQQAPKEPTLVITDTLEQTDNNYNSPNFQTDESDLAEPITAISKYGEEYNPQTHVELNGQVFDKEKNISYTEKIEFVPNYAILMYKSDLDTKLSDLVTFLHKNPEKKITIRGNGGMENYNEMLDTLLNEKPMLFGSSLEVYLQKPNDLGNHDAYELQRIEEEGYPKVIVKNKQVIQVKRAFSEVETSGSNENNDFNILVDVKVGDLLQARANYIKEYLITKGINKDRVKARKGKFLDREYHDVIIYIK